MKNIFKFSLFRTLLVITLILGIVLLIVSNCWATAGVEEDHSETLSSRVSCVSKVSDTLYIGEREQDSDLHFVMERLTDDNIALWDDFEEGQNKSCDDAWDKYAALSFEKLPLKTKKFLCLINVTKPNGGAMTIESGRVAFRESLRLYKKLNSEIWIAYVLANRNIREAQPLAKEDFQNIEMVVTVLTSPDSPVTIHMGICRSVYYEIQAFEGIMKSHKSLSITLHAFAAQVMRGSDFKKFWMMTTPVDKMKDLLISSFSRDHYYAGYESKKIFESKDGKLFIYDDKGNTINSFIAQDIKDNKDWAAFFGGHSCFFTWRNKDTFTFNIEKLALLYK